MATIQRLQVHLPNEQCITFGANSNLATVLDTDRVRRTTLTEYFEANRMYKLARCYADLPTTFRWDPSMKKWIIRQRGIGIGRVVFPGERYFLRMLLNSVKGARSYEELRTYNGRIYEGRMRCTWALRKWWRVGAMLAWGSHHSVWSSITLALCDHPYTWIPKQPTTPMERIPRTPLRRLQLATSKEWSWTSHPRPSWQLRSKRNCSIAFGSLLAHSYDRFSRSRSRRTFVILYFFTLLT